MDHVKYSVTDMSYMFYYATNFNQDLSSWDVNAVASCGDFGHTGCNPVAFFDLCPTGCCPTEVNNSNYAAEGSITGNAGDIVEVTCDFSFVGGGDAVCNATTGVFDVGSCFENVDQCLDPDACPLGGACVL